MIDAGGDPGGTWRANADRDTWIDAYKTSDQHGNDTELRVRENTPDKMRRSLFGYDFSAVPAGLTGYTATAHFWSRDDKTVPINLHAITGAWTEATTWSNAPTFDPTSSASFTMDRKEQFLTADVTSLVQSWLGGSLTDHGLILIGANNEEARISSSEADTAERPYIEIVKPATPGSPTETFTQGSPLAADLQLVGDATVKVDLYANVTSGVMPPSPASSGVLRFGADSIALTGASFAGGVLTLSGPVPSGGLTAGAGDVFELEVTSAQAGVAFTIRYDAAAFPSQIVLPTVEPLQVTAVGVYDAPYPGGTVLSETNNGLTAYVRATVTDPFGADDITAAAVEIPAACASDPGIAGVAMTEVASTADSKTFEYVWVTGVCEGVHDITVTASEGTEGAVTAQGSTQLPVSFLDLGTPSALQFVEEGTLVDAPSYEVGDLACVLLTDIDEAGAGTMEITVTIAGGGTEVLTLTEWDIASNTADSPTGRFYGCVAGPPLPYGAGDVLTASYTDPDDPSDRAPTSLRSSTRLRP